jgi:hypothetical protein
MLARPRARLTTKIGPKLSSCPHMNFIEQLASVFGRPLFESD